MGVFRIAGNVRLTQMAVAELVEVLGAVRIQATLDGEKGGGKRRIIGGGFRDGLRTKYSVSK